MPKVAEFYKNNHGFQTLEFGLAKERQYFALNKDSMSIWEASKFLNTLVDESDQDTDLTQIEHLMQTSEAIRQDGHARWMIVAGFIHDLGKTSASMVGRSRRDLSARLRVFRQDGLPRVFGRKPGQEGT